MSVFNNMDEQRKDCEEKINFISEQLSAVLESNVKVMLTLEKIQQDQKALSIKCDGLQQTISRLAANNRDFSVMFSNIEREVEDVYNKTEDLSQKCNDIEFAVHNIKIYKSVSDF